LQAFSLAGLSVRLLFEEGFFTEFSAIFLILLARLFGVFDLQRNDDKQARRVYQPLPQHVACATRPFRQLAPCPAGLPPNSTASPYTIGF